MKRVVSIELDNVRYFYCGWYAFEGERYPKYTTNKSMALIFLNKAYALNMVKTNNGYILKENTLIHIDESDLKIG